jgi:hypothetical protein
VAVHPGTKVERDLLRLVYVSAAAPSLGPDDLAAIAGSSAERNRAAGLTGLLLHEGDSFYAVLEGPRRRLLARMERIITDRRHSGVEILLEAATADRRFDSWSFGSLPDSARPHGSAGAEFLRILRCRLK